MVNKYTTCIRRLASIKVNIWSTHAYGDLYKQTHYIYHLKLHSNQLNSYIILPNFLIPLCDYIVWCYGCIII